ncbi:phage major capsid protein [Kosakonia pseudosacchari]
MTRGERVIAFIERFCIVPEGKLIGKPMRLDPFQKEFILAVYDNPAGTDMAILSIARKNGKTGLIAGILLAHLVGPEAVQNTQIVSGALSREQAAIVFNLAVKMVKQGTFDAKTFNKSLGSDADSAGSLIQPMQIPGIIMPGLRRLTIRDLLAQGRISSNALEYVREEVFTNNADVVAEKALKPESDITFSKQTANVKTIAHWVQASRQVMDDAPMLQSYVNNRLMYGLALKEEGQLLNGDGTGDNLEGLNKVATAYDTSLNATGDTRADIIAHAIYQVTESEFSASGIVLNPRDWHNIALLKDNEGRYIFGGPQAFTSNIMWGLPVVPTKAQAAGTFTVGGFDMASQVWDRMDATVEVSREDRDNFVKNMLTILCEERLALAHYRPTAIIKGTFSSGS